MPVERERVEQVTDELDLGERAAIALASAVHADLLLIDEAEGRAEATRRNLRVTGTIGVLRAAAELGLVKVADVLARLRDTSFYADDACSSPRSAGGSNDSSQNRLIHRPE
jgi:predicted nucleic acid-binding protein